MNQKPKLSFKKVFIVALTIFIILLLGSNIISSNKKGLKSTSDNSSITQGEPEKLPDINISMAVIGDIMCHGPNYQDAYNSSTKEYDFSTFFPQIKNYISQADVAIGNLETTFAGGTRAYSGYPTFNSPVALAEELKEIGVDILTTSNNHSLDTGYNGLVNTIEELDKLGFKHTGTFKSEEEKNEILIHDVNGIKIAFLSYTYGTNGIPVPKGKDYCVNLIDKKLIKSHLDKAKELNPDLICVSMHWGVEYTLKPNTEQKDLANFLFENGADVILGSHPHVLEPMEKREITLEDGTTKDGFIIYSLGNFMSAQKDKYTKDSIILNLKITKNQETGKTSVTSYDYTPIYMQDSGANAKDRYQIVDLNKAIADYESGNSSISKTSYNTYLSELKNIKTALQEPTTTTSTSTSKNNTTNTTATTPKNTTQTNTLSKNSKVAA